MKKIVYLFIGILFCISCKKEKDPETTYQIINNSTLNPTGYQYLDGSVYELMIFHYKGTDIIKQDNIDQITAGGGKSEIITVPAGSEKIKISFKFLPPQSPYYDEELNDRQYVVAYTIIEQGKNNISTLNDNTAISETMGKLNLGDELLHLESELKNGYEIN